jgi:prephenate dehydratase
MTDKTEALHVAYLGPEASFSHQAAIDVFQSSGSVSEGRSVSLYPLPSFSAIFSAIQQSSSTTSQAQKSPTAAPSSPAEGIHYDYALLPVENSTNGSVVQVLDLLAQCGLDSSASYPDLEVCAEYYLPVHHFLFVSPDAREQGSSSEDLVASIRTLYTHPQVWGQCTRYLSRHFSPKAVERIDVGSTSAAAQLVARQAKSSVTDGTNAAISSQLAGQRHKLVCLAEEIEDEPGKNTTRFFVVRNKNRLLTREEGLGFRQATDNNQGENRYKSLITFTIPHTKPGALADALAVFKTYGFNLTSIDTRPGRKRNWQYVFFVECEEADPPKEVGQGEENICRMLKELGRFTESLRYLGRFVDRLPKNKYDESS